MRCKLSTALALAICTFVTASNSYSYSISGYVKDGGLYDPGIENVEVSITGDWNGSVTTDSNGYYIKTDLANGDYTVSASKAGYVF